MVRIIYTGQALDDLDRLTDYLLESEPAYAPETTDLIMDAIKMLADHPLVGRPAEDNLRELIISRGHTGYVALYSQEDEDTVLVLAIRHQREAGYVDRLPAP